MCFYCEYLHVCGLCVCVCVLCVCMCACVCVCVCVYVYHVYSVVFFKVRQQTMYGNYTLINLQIMQFWQVD